MEQYAKLPTELVDRVKLMEREMIKSATGEDADDQLYERLRTEFMRSEELRNYLPEFVRTHRTLKAFWPYIKNEAGSYQERRQIISTAFTPLIDFLELGDRHPGDHSVSYVLSAFDADGVSAIWQKAMSRRNSDPEGAITVARTLLETVCKRILDECGATYSDKEDLPKLYSMTAKVLNLAPDQHSEEPIKAILGGAMNLVNGIGTLRNRLSDSHGRGGRLPVKPSPRHASLTVNIAGAMATFLVETYLEKGKK